MRIELIDRIDRLKEIKGQWLELMSRSAAGDFFLLPQWLFAWWSVFHPGKALYFVALWQAERLCALFPLVKVRRGPFRVISFAGLPRAGRMDFLLADDCRPACLTTFTDWLFERSDWDLLSLRAFGPFSENPGELSRILSEKRTPYTLTKEAVSYYIPISEHEDLEHYLTRTRSAKTRKAFRRKKRKLEKERNAQWDVSTTLSDILVDEMAHVDVHRSMRGESGRSFFAAPENTAFLKALAKELAGEDCIRVVCLKSGGRLYAFDLLFFHAGNVLSYQTAFDRDLYSFGAGNLTLLESLQLSFTHEMATYDFLSGDDSYKSEWADQCHQNWRLQLYGKGLRAYPLIFYHRVIKPLRRRMSALPWVRNRLPRNLRSRWDI